MSESVEGDWGDFRMKMISKEDYPEVLDHLKRVFFRDETMFRLVNYSDDLGNEVFQRVEFFLNQNDGLSFMAIHKSSNKVAGVRIIYRNEKDSFQRMPEFPAENPEHKKILGFMIPVIQAKNIHEEFCVDFYAELFMTSVDPEFRRRGLVSEFYDRSLKLLRQKGYPLAESLFSSPYTRKVAIKLGFEEVDRYYFAESRLEDGTRRFPNASPDQFTARMVIRL